MRGAAVRRVFRLIYAYLAGESIEHDSKRENRRGNISEREDGCVYDRSKPQSTGSTKFLLGACSFTPVHASNAL